MLPHNINFENPVSILTQKLLFIIKNKSLERIYVLILNNFALLKINKQKAMIFVFAPGVF